MGSYKWGYKSPNIRYKYSYPTVVVLLNLHVTTHEPPSSLIIRPLLNPKHKILP